MRLRLVRTRYRTVHVVIFRGYTWSRASEIANVEFAKEPKAPKGE